MKLKEWLYSPQIRELQQISLGDLYTKEFFREPFRNNYRDSNCFYSPADGTIVYVYPRIGPTDKIIEIKGVNYTVQDLLENKKYQFDSLVIGIFMTVYDVHTNSMPTDGYISKEELTPPILTHRTTMIPFENGLLSEMKINPDSMQYLFENERKILTIINPKFHSEYHIIQIADREVDVITNWGIGDYLLQGDSFGTVRYGSQVDLVIPLIPKLNKYKFKIKVEKLDHVEANKDELVFFEKI